MSEPLISTLVDPDFAEEVDAYVEESLPERVEALLQAAADGDRTRLSWLAHQMVGSAESYGFKPITDAAVLLEQAADKGSDAAIATRLREVVDLCRRARAR